MRFQPAPRASRSLHLELQRAGLAVHDAPMQIAELGAVGGKNVFDEVTSLCVRQGVLFQHGEARRVHFHQSTRDIDDLHALRLMRDDRGKALHVLVHRLFHTPALDSASLQEVRRHPDEYADHQRIRQREQRDPRLRAKPSGLLSLEFQPAESEWQCNRRREPAHQRAGQERAPADCSRSVRP